MIIVQAEERRDVIAAKDLAIMKDPDAICVAGQVSPDVVDVGGLAAVIGVPVLEE